MFRFYYPSTNDFLGHLSQREINEWLIYAPLDVGYEFVIYDGSN